MRVLGFASELGFVELDSFDNGAAFFPGTSVQLFFYYERVDSASI